MLPGRYRGAQFSSALRDRYVYGNRGCPPQCRHSLGARDKYGGPARNCLWSQFRTDGHSLLHAHESLDTATYPEDIVTVLHHHEVYKPVILNGHGGNAFQNAIRELELRFPQMIVCMVNWWRVRPVREYFDHPGDHADEMETSAMMAVHPELVLPLEYAGDGREHRFNIKGLREKWAWIRRWITPQRYGWEISLSTPEKGRRFLMTALPRWQIFNRSGGIQRIGSCER